MPCLLFLYERNEEEGTMTTTISWPTPSKTVNDEQQQQQSQQRAAAPWRVQPVKQQKQAAPAPMRSITRFFRRQEPTTFQRCLAIHLHYAGPRSGLD
jgi:hypothetical protein